MSIPDKRTVIAAATYGLCKPVTIESRKGVIKQPWSCLSAAQQQPFISAAEILMGQTFGVEPQNVDRAKLAATLESAKIDEVDANANTIVGVFVNLTSVLG